MIKIRWPLCWNEETSYSDIKIDEALSSVTCSSFSQLTHKEQFTRALQTPQVGDCRLKLNWYEDLKPLYIVGGFKERSLLTTFVVVVNQNSIRQ